MIYTLPHKTWCASLFEELDKPCDCGERITELEARIDRALELLERFRPWGDGESAQRLFAIQDALTGEDES